MQDLRGASDLSRLPMAGRVEQFDWSVTALGARNDWPHSLRTAAEMALALGFPALLLCGDAGVAIYNDAYDALLCGADDLGRRGLGVLSPFSESLEPALQKARAGETVTFENLPLPLRREGVDDACFTVSVSPVRDELGAGGVLLIFIETTERVRASRSRNLVVAELQHRVRNILAVIRSIVARTAETSLTVEDFSAHLDGRLSALARTQVMLTRNPGLGVDLEGLVRDEFVAQVVEESRLGVAGPEIMLSAKAAEVMTLAVHELTTNAVKYGALAARGGRIEISWSVEDQAGVEWLAFEWRESGVKVAAPAPRRTGFGVVLVEQRVPYELKGTGRLSFLPGGVLCAIAFPLSPLRSILQTDGV